jgi:negative regulator of flagellin synthesis FlgM
MIISGTQLLQVIKQYRDNAQMKKSENKGALPVVKQTDSVMLSREALNIQLLHKELGEIPEVREEKVHAVTEQVRSGTYNISGEEIVEKIIARTIADGFVLDKEL